MQRVSRIAERILKECDEDTICFYSAGITDDVFAKAWPQGGKMHPLDKAKRVVNAIDRESRHKGAIFDKVFVNVWGRLVRCFILKVLCGDKGGLNVKSR